MDEHFLCVKNLWMGEPSRAPVNKKISVLKALECCKQLNLEPFKSLEEARAFLLSNGAVSKCVLQALCGNELVKILDMLNFGEYTTAGRIVFIPRESLATLPRTTEKLNFAITFNHYMDKGERFAYFGRIVIGQIVLYVMWCTCSQFPELRPPVTTQSSATKTWMTIRTLRLQDDSVRSRALFAWFADIGANFTAHSLSHRIAIYCPAQWDIQQDIVPYQSKFYLLAAPAELDPMTSEMRSVFEKITETRGFTTTDDLKTACLVHFEDNVLRQFISDYVSKILLVNNTNGLG